jgi:hypothetical protein
MTVVIATNAIQKLKMNLNLEGVSSAWLVLPNWCPHSLNHNNLQEYFKVTKKRGAIER